MVCGEKWLAHVDNMEPEARVYNACIWVFREHIDSSIEQQQCTGSLAWRLLGNAATLL